jgi:Holliday junction resolvase
VKPVKDAYGSGVYYEKRTAAALVKDGYAVIESRGSHGPADLWAAKPGQLLFVQVKKGDATLADQWLNELYALARTAGGIAILADWPTRGKLRLRQIIGWHRKHSQYWPLAPFTTDEIARPAKPNTGGSNGLQSHLLPGEP